jgi:hypothetical protein
MADRGPTVGDLQAGLAEIDDRLREIQKRLLSEYPDLGVLPLQAPEHPTPKGRYGPLAEILKKGPRPAEQAELRLVDLRRQIDALAELRARLLASIRELLDGYDAALRAGPEVVDVRLDAPEPATS